MIFNRIYRFMVKAPLTAHMDLLADLFTHPDDWDRPRPLVGLEGQMADARNIRGYFQKAISHVLGERGVRRT